VVESTRNAARVSVCDIDTIDSDNQTVSKVLDVHLELLLFVEQVLTRPHFKAA